MKILVDKNHLLVVENSNIPKLKKYEHNASGYSFSDYDKGIVVYHKKCIKIINLKNLGNNMGVFYIKRRENIFEKKFDQNGFLTALRLFNGFDEHTGNSYYYIPRIKETEAKILDEILGKLGVDVKIEKTEKGFVVDSALGNDIKNCTIENIGDIHQIISFLFGLVLVYGKMEIKNGEILSIKIHIPLFGQYVKYKDEFDSMIKELQRRGIFLNHSILQNKDGIIYQINSSDYELLGYFVDFYQSVEKIQKIFKRSFTQEVKLELVHFLQTNSEVPEAGKEEVMALLEDGMIKILEI